MTETNDFLAALTAVYRQNPARVLPNALWKTVQQLGAGDYELALVCDAAGPIVLRACSDEMLAVFWSRDSAAQIPMACLETVSLALVHADHATEKVCRQFAVRQPYFRLRHSLAPISGAVLPPGYAFAPVRLPTEAEIAAELIGSCYAALHPSPEAVRSWASHPVYAPELWLWVMDTVRGEPVGLGIAEFDAGVGEGSLEWIQILPAYRGLGLGRALVIELLRRLPPLQAAFATVGGEAGGLHSPEAFYRRCGFQGRDVWWVLRRS